MAITTGTSVSLVNAPQIAGQQNAVDPVLQAQDGSFIGATFEGSMVAFDQTGNVRWVVPNYTPQIATDDGGGIAQYCMNGNCSAPGPAVTFDSNGNATGQIGNLPTYSWPGYAYQVGSVNQWLKNAINVAKSWWPFNRGNASGNNTAVQQPWYAPLKSCPGASPGALKRLLRRRSAH